MTEKRIIGTKKIQFEGIFSAKELYAVINEPFDTKSYDKYEPLNQEIVKEDGKDIKINLIREKKFSDYYKAVIEIQILLRKLKDVEVEIDGKRKNMKKGMVSVEFKEMMFSDYEGKWIQGAWYFLTRTLADKFFNKKIYSDFLTQLKEDGAESHRRAIGYLNFQKNRI